MKTQETKDKRIKTIQQLKKLANTENGLDCFILLRGGLRSSKNIRYDSDENRFFVWNFIDDTELELTEKQILGSAFSNIGEAMKLGALVMD